MSKKKNFEVVCLLRNEQICVTIVLKDLSREGVSFLSSLTVQLAPTEPLSLLPATTHTNTERRTLHNGHDTCERYSEGERVWIFEREESQPHHFSGVPSPRQSQQERENSPEPATSPLRQPASVQFGVEPTHGTIG